MTWFQRRLKKKNLSQVEVARRMGLHPSTLSRIVNGRRRVWALEAQHIAKILGVPLDKVLEQMKGKPQ